VHEILVADELITQHKQQTKKQGSGVKEKSPKLVAAFP
jgi:hypothetical protein